METNYPAGQTTVIEEAKQPRGAAIPVAGRASVVIALLLVYVIWGSTYLAIHFAIEGFPPFLMGGIRFVIAGALMYAFLRLRGASSPTGRQWAGASAVGLLLLVGGNGGVMFAEQWVSSGLAALAIGAVPLWAALFAGIWGRWPSRVEWLGLGLGFVGLALLNLEGDMRANPLGAAALVVASMCWAFGSVWSTRLTLPVGLMGSAAEMLVAGVALSVIGLGTGERITTMPSERSIWALVYLIVFGSLIGYTAYTYLLRHVRSTLATSYAYVNPMVAVALGVALAGEEISGVGLAAMAIILGGVVLVVMGRSLKFGSRRRAA